MRRGVYKHMGRPSLTLEDMQELARGHEGKCLSTKYKGMKEKLAWQCKEGHIWEAVPSSIKYNKAWCPVCAKKSVGRFTLEDMQKLAREHEGRCLSSEYLGTKKKLTWECKEGHVWRTTPFAIKHRHSWCPVCADRTRGGNRLTLEDMRKLAREYGGKCLSTEYVNTKEKLTWECREGHVWRTAPLIIKYNKTWCPVCAVNKYSNTLSESALGDVQIPAGVLKLRGRPRLTLEDAQALAKERGGKCLSTEYMNMGGKAYMGV